MSEWHDLRKNPDDLPVKDRNVLLVQGNFHVPSDIQDIVPIPKYIYSTGKYNGKGSFMSWHGFHPDNAMFITHFDYYEIIAWKELDAFDAV